MEENYFCNMRNLNIDKITQRLFEISEYGTHGRYYNPSYGDDTLKEQEEEATAADTALAGELDALGAEATAPVEAVAPAEGAAPVEGAPMEAETSPEGDEVEIDVTDIVSGVKKAEDTVEKVDDKVDALGGQVNDYIEKLLQANETLLNKVTELEKNMNKQFVQRTPTPYEQLMLRSMSSYPYTQQLTDYWKQGTNNMYVANKSFNSNGTEQEEDETPKEYKLTYKDINDSFSDVDVRKTF